MQKNIDDSSTCNSNDRRLHADKQAWQTPSLRELSVSLDTQFGSGSVTDGLSGNLPPG